MHTIIAGRFEQQDESEHAVRELMQAGFAHEHVSSFYLNPPGRHDTYPIGGDEDRSEGAEDSPKGLAAGTGAGAAVGAAVGAATLPVTGPLGAVAGAMVGAHIGNVAAGLGAMKDDTEQGEDPPMRHWGMMVAVAVESDEQAERAVRLLSSMGAQDIERASGTIENGDWADFNPISTPHFLHIRQQDTRT